MGSQKYLNLLTTILVMTLTASCGQFTTSVETPLPLQPTRTGSNSTPISLSTLTPVPSPAFTPTSTIEEARARFLDLLANNGNCRLPCFWGITPGKSTHQEAQKILEQFTSISNLTGFRIDGGSVAPMYEEGDTTLVANAGFLSNEAVVSHIAFFAGEQKAVNTTNGAGFEPVFDSQTFGERLSYYMIPHLLADQGIPTSVMIAPHGGEAGFGILLLFPEKGILINYTAQMYSEGLKISGCPANAHIQMELYPSGTSESFYEALKLTDWSTRLNYYKPLEEVTSLSIKEFYQTFKGSTDGCVETSVEFWPTPVP